MADEWSEDETALVLPKITGLTTAEPPCDIHQLIEELSKEYDRLKAIKNRSQNQRIEFKEHVVGITYIADAHIGHQGVNIRRLLDEAKLINETRGLWSFTVGDMVENMILAKLVNSRLNTEIAPTKEWELLKYYLMLIGPKMIGAVCGNHDFWLTSLTGIPFFREAVATAAPQALYASDDVRFVLDVNGAEFPVRARHKWRYKSKFNDSHGIEDMCRFDGDFVCGIGAHWHSAGEVREYNNKGKQGLAVICGSYKDIDEYMVKCGFPKPNCSTAVTVLYFDDGRMLGVSDLKLAADLIRRYRR